ncbi:uncharacterized protein A1O9_07684 [Exophiala aquamarina CBS 119918]|uniref:KOW domain-containing protein n=1 Tax=Exophiala aquamarina CBS 119918 TaxID=1182545 RepID=A0A072PA01_9EURO|nr:uncharacterized protein A1O9_07684 [Exophiala aquamarina CBS 119918]KEF56103.1 hypothetical protein A1O9_07684 [Exophiala aquamarina CBS 119918]
MQKVLRINLNARNQALQKARRKHLKELKKDWQTHDDHRILLDRESRTLVKNERKERREDWFAGPLAPKRDVGKNHAVYGALSSAFMKGPDIPNALSKWPKSKGDDLIGDDWRGKGNEGNLVEGDRVCVVHGADAIVGQIGTIHEIFKERRELTIKGFNTADVRMDPGQTGRKQRPFQPFDRPIPIDDVRVVFRHTESDPITGRVIRDRDVLVESIEGRGPYFERDNGSPLPRHTRYVAGSKTEIPWPSVESVQFTHFPGDTRRLELEKRTYTPSVHENPLPHPSIIDELRPKYQNDRMAHEYDYVAKKIVEDARSKWYEERGINTPAMELQQKLREKSRQRALELQAALKAETSPQRNGLPDQDVKESIEDFEMDEAAQDQDGMGYRADWEKEVVVHEAPTNITR